MDIVDFHKEINRYFTSGNKENREEEQVPVTEENRRRSHHEVAKRKGRAVGVRKHCKRCYEKGECSKNC